MAKHGKKYLAALAKVDMNKHIMNRARRLPWSKKPPITKFDATVEVHMRMGLDPRQADQQVRDVVVLPNGLGKTVRVLVFAQGEGAASAQEAGADFIADSDEWITKIQGGWTDFDVAIATPDMMGKVGRLGRVLGPRGLMPNPKAGTVVPAEDLPRVIKEAKAGRVEFRLDKTANIHVPIGKVSFDSRQTVRKPGRLDGSHQKGQAGGCQGHLSPPHHGDLDHGPWRQSGCQCWPRPWKTTE